MINIFHFPLNVIRSFLLLYYILSSTHSIPRQCLNPHKNKIQDKKKQEMWRY